jgi:hypothetical protein
VKNFHFVSRYAGIVCIPVYVAFTFISHIFNTKINPLINWLSDFGNYTLNPSGALFYNAGCILVALLLAVFYLGLAEWYKKREIEKKYIICYVCARISGIAASVFLVLASVLTLGTNDALHGTFSMLNMIGMDCFIVFTSIAFVLHPDIKSRIGITGFIAVAFNIVTMNFFSDFYLAEWIYFMLFMIYVVIVTVNYNKLVQYKSVSKDPKALA